MNKDMNLNPQKLGETDPLRPGSGGRGVSVYQYISLGD
jgi:hypothetical protein